jgi:hypothetical protein
LKFISWADAALFSGSGVDITTTFFDILFKNLRPAVCTLQISVDLAKLCQVDCGLVECMPFTKTWLITSCVHIFVRRKKQNRKKNLSQFVYPIDMIIIIKKQASIIILIIMIHTKYKPSEWGQCATQPLDASVLSYFAN